MTVDPREIGDWTVPDADFLGAFRLPDTSTKRDRLADQNEHTRDKRIQFFEEEHYYTIDGHRAPWSVTKLCHLLCTEFDPDRAVVSMKRGSEWHKKRAMYTKEDGEVMTDEEIKAKWEYNGKVQSARGTLMHFTIEMHVNGYSLSQSPSPEFELFLRFYKEVVARRGWVPYRTEFSVFHCGLSIAGQIDFLGKEEHTDNYVIVDWKRSKEIKFSDRRRLKPPLQHLFDCNFTHYCIQLNSYKYILETEYNMKISSMWLGVFHPNQNRPLLIEVGDMQAEVTQLYEHCRATYKGIRPPQPMDAEFIPAEVR